MPDPNDQFDLEELKPPDAMSLEPLPDVELLGEAVPVGAAPAAETPAPEAVPPVEAAEEPAASEPVEEDKKGKKKAGKKEKAKKTKETSQDSTGEEKGGVEEKNKFSDLLQHLTQASPYTVMLGGAVVFLLIAVLIMFGELLRYHLDVKAKEAKERVSMRLSLDQAEIDLLRG